jgi:PAS domain S-box-containing protein
MVETERDPTGTSGGWRLALALLVLHGLLFLASEYSGPFASKPGWQTFYESAAFLPLQAASAWALFAASRRDALHEGTRRGLRWLAAGFAFVAVGSVIWLINRAIGTPLRYVSWADSIFFLFYPCIVLGLRALPTIERPHDRVRDGVGRVVVILALGSLVVLAARVDAATPGSTPGERLLVILTSVAQLTTLIWINRAIESARRIPSANALTLLLLGLAISVFADLFFSLVYSYGYRGINWSIAAAVVTNWLVFLGAMRFRTDAVDLDDASNAPQVLFSPVPMVAVIAVALLLVWLAREGPMVGVGPTLLGLTLLSALLVSRDLLAARAAAEVLREGALRKAERRLEALVRHANDAIVLLDDGGRVLYASAPIEALLGVPPAALEGRRLDGLMPESDRTSWNDFLARLRAAPDQPATHEWRFARADGETRLIESVGRDLRDEPAVRGLVLNSRDVTERASLEERLQQAQKLEVAGRLAGGVAHDFNNVLTAVIAGTELAVLSLEPGHPALQDLESVEAAAERGAALTRRLLAFVRQEPVPAQRVDLGEMLAELAPLLRRLAGDAIELQMVVSPGLGDVLVDRTELEHVIFNLVANSRDAMLSGGPVVVSAEPVTITGQSARDGFIIQPPEGSFASISVADTGTGMPDDVRRRMFDPFFTQKSGGRGTGLGLIGVRPLIEGARGGLRVDSSPGAGTKVTLLLPLVVAALDETAERTAVAMPPRRPSDPGRPAFGVGTAPTSLPGIEPHACVLLVEDEPAVRNQLSRLLLVRGFAVVPTASATEARLALAENPNTFDIVVSDVMMPGETGLEFAAWLRRMYPALPLLLISGHTGAALDRESRMVDGLPLLRKPFTGVEFSERLEELLRKT